MNINCGIMFMLGAMIISCPRPGAASAWRNPDGVVDILQGVPLLSTSMNVDHSYWLSRLLFANTSKEELDCFKIGRVYFQGRCEKLFEQGPCEPFQFLVLRALRYYDGGVEPMKLVPECHLNPCGPGEAVMQGTINCVPIHLLCPEENREFRYTFSGRGQCHCKGSRIQITPRQETGYCAEMYTNANCPAGQVIAPWLPGEEGRWESTFFGVCVYNPCPLGQIRVDTRQENSPIECEIFNSHGCKVVKVPLLTPELGVDVPMVNCDYSSRSTHMNEYPIRRQSNSWMGLWNDEEISDVSGLIQAWMG